MCGFFGIVAGQEQVIDPTIITAGIRVIAHRGPDDDGQIQQQNWALGHQRLSIFDLSAAGRQPFRYQGCYLVFNGAIYNYLELREELKLLGYSFTTQTDTEVIVAAYLAWGTDCVQRFNGMWAFALIDPVRKRLFCSRDRFGIKPFYYYQTDFFAFASEIKAFSALPQWRPQLNHQRAYEYLAYGWQDHTNDTLFAGVEQLPAGHNLTLMLEGGTISLQAYYHLNAISTYKATELSLEEATLRLRELLRASTSLRLQADVPTALTLSGGLDSSSVAGLSREILGPHTTIHAFSVIFPGHDIDESAYVQAVAAQHRLDTHAYAATARDCWREYERVLQHQDEPFSSAAVAAHFTLMERAQSQGFKVLLNGQGADEILAGYDRFYGPWFRTLSPWRWPLAATQLCWNGGLSSKRLWKYLRPPTDVPQLFGPSLRHGEARLFRRSTDHNLRECSEHLLGEVGFPVMLHYEDRNAMAHGIEMRTPFLDYRLVEFALALPDKYKLRYGQRKYLLRQAMQDYLPPAVRRRRRKLGFATPQNQWIDENQVRIRAELQRAGTAYPGLFQPTLGPWVADALDRRRYSDYPLIWRMFSFVRWLEVFGVEIAVHDS